MNETFMMNWTPNPSIGCDHEWLDWSEWKQLLPELPLLSRNRICRICVQVDFQNKELGAGG